jgi:hypothetical protein
MFVGPQVINPELVCPGFFSGWFAVEEEDVGLLPVRLGPLRVEDAGWQKQKVERV